MLVRHKKQNLFIDTTTCSSGIAKGLQQYCVERGLDIARHAKATGLDLATFGDGMYRLNIGRFSALLSALAEESGDEAFGLQLGEAYQLGDAGPVGLAMIHAPNAGTMWRFYQKVADLLVEQTIHSLTENTTYLINENACSPLIQNIDTFTDLMSVIFIRHVRVHIGQNWMIPRIEFQRKKPKDPGPWRRIFGNNLSFGRPFARNYIVLEDLKRGNPDADPRLFEVLSKAALKMHAEFSARQEFMDRVRSIITRNLQLKRATLPVVASDMAMSERSLQRLLAKHDTDFGTLSLEIRLGMARALLSQTDLRITDIADRCGYSSIASFSRAITRAEGIGPVALRRSLTL